MACLFMLGLLGIVPDAAQAGDSAVTPGWDGYQVVMWQPGGAARAQGLKALGFTAGQVTGGRNGIDPAAIAHGTEVLRAAGLRWYVENIATDFYSPYHRWTPDHPVGWLFEAARQRHAADPASPAPFLRLPSLSDPAWQRRIAARLAENVAAYREWHPLWYALGDETGIAELLAPWDFDLSPDSLAGMRHWLRGQYGSLDALNRQWGSDFATWDAVVPMGTTAALARADDNFSAWSDFKAWMDAAFAGAVRAGTEAVHAADPTALAAIEGAQPPGWGGYDYTHLAGAVDVMEMYERGNDIEIARDLDPALAVVTTNFQGGAEALRLVWHQALLGARGLIVWDETGAVVDAMGRPGPRGAELAPVIGELRGPVGAALGAAQPSYDPVAILYSPASFRVHWLLDRRADPHPWEARTSEDEYERAGPWRAAMGRAVDRLVRLGVQPRFIAPEALAGGGLATLGVKVLVLPEAIALSDAEAAAIRTFVTGGGAVLTDGETGMFDGHGRRRAQPALGGLALDRMEASGDVPSPALLDRLATRLEAAGVRPGLVVTGVDGRRAARVEIRRLALGPVTLVGLLWAGAEDPGRVTVTLSHAAWVRDLRGTAPARWTDRVEVAIPRDGPVLLAVSRSPLPSPLGPRRQP